MAGGGLQTGGEGGSGGVESEQVSAGKEMDPHAPFCLLFAAECLPGTMWALVGITYLFLLWEDPRIHCSL